jgi:hypothetical protein
LHFFLDARARYAVVRGHAEFDTELEAAVRVTQAGAQVLYRSCDAPVLPSFIEVDGGNRFPQNRTVNVRHAGSGGAGVT